MRAWCTTRSMASATCSRIAACGSPSPAISASVSSRRSASSGEPACTVRERAVVTGRHRAEHVERLGAANLADDDPVGPHAQRVAHEPADRHLAAALDARRPRLEPDDVPGRSRSSAASSIVTIRSPAGRKADSAPSVVVLPEPVPPQTRMFRRRAHGRARAGRAAAASTSPGARARAADRPLRAEAADRQHRPVDRERRQHHVHARAVGQPRVAERLGLVDAAAQRARGCARSRCAGPPRRRTRRRSAASRPPRSTHTGRVP